MRYEIGGDGAHRTIDVDCLGDALDALRDWLREGWEPTESTFWVDGYAAPLDENGDQIEDEKEWLTVEIQPEEPECESGEHDWQSPHGLVGGCKENPGVWGHGGGVYINEACVKCGCGKTTDTWAQRPDTGEQGLRSVKYEPGKYELEGGDDD